MPLCQVHLDITVVETLEEEEASSVQEGRRLLLPNWETSPGHSPTASHLSL